MALDESVRSWLTAQGYPLEMRVAEIIRESNAGWDHGRVYQDPITGKYREIDLMGYFDFWGEFKLGVHLVFECKHTR
jgi:hypothetical protein